MLGSVLRASGAALRAASVLETSSWTQSVVSTGKFDGRFRSKFGP